MSTSTAPARRIIVLGGSGYLGSAICRSALSQSFHVQSISTSGKPALTPGGHRRAWTHDVEWLKGSAFDPVTYEGLLKPTYEGERVAVVSTLGTLLPDPGKYRDSVRSGNVLGLVGAWWGAMTGGGSGGQNENPLMRDGGAGSEADQAETSAAGYDRMNRLSATIALQTLLSTLSTRSTTQTSSSDTTSVQTPPPPFRPTTPFIYISAEDIFRPLIPSGYILSKRRAERDLWRMVWEWGQAELSVREGREEGAHGVVDGARVEGGVRPVFIRPGLMYHPHNRPLSTPLAVALDLTSRLPLPPPTSDPTKPLTPITAFIALGQSLSIPPIHVDHVAECVVRAVLDERVIGVVGTRDMRRWVGLEVGDGSEPVRLGKGVGDGHGGVPIVG